MKVPISAKVSVGLAVTLLLLLVVAASALQSTRAISRAAGSVAHALDVESDISDLEVALVGAESATRGFVLTGDERYLSAYKGSPALATQELAGLRRKTADDPVQQRHIDALRPLIAIKLDRLARAVEIRRRQGLEASMPQLGSGVGRELMNRIRSELHAMTSEEERLLSERNALQVASGRRTERFILLTAVLAGAFVAVAGLVIQRDLVGRRRAEEALRSLSMIDELTGLYNRRGFLIHADDRCKLANRLGTREVLVFADVDGLKAINDTFGHSAGDEALVVAAQLLRASFRESDVVARLGGDEFVVLALMDRIENQEIPLATLKGRLDAWNAQGARRFRLSMSIGATLLEPGARLEELLDAADREMYAKKQESRISRQSDPDAVTVSD